MVRLLHTCGLCLGAPLDHFGAQARVRQEDFYRTFERLLELAREEQTQLLLISGDLFASPRPERECLERVRGGLEALVAAGIQPVLLPGACDDSLTADAVYRRGGLPGAVLNPRGDAVLLDCAGGPVRITAGGTLVEPADGVIEVAVAAGSGSGLTAGVAAGDRPAYFALGGGGTFQLLEADGVAYGCRPGSPEGRDFSETGPRHAALVEADLSGCRVAALPIQSRLLLERQVILEGGEDDREVAALIRQAAEGESAVRVILTGPAEQPLDLSALHVAASGAFFFLDLCDRTRLGGSRTVARLAAEDTVRGLCLRKILERLEQADPAQAELLEAALREVMVRLQLFAVSQTP